MLKEIPQNYFSSLFYEFLSSSYKNKYFFGSVKEIASNVHRTKNEEAVVNYYHKALHLGCCSSPRSASGGLAFIIYLYFLPHIGFEE